MNKIQWWDVEEYKIWKGIDPNKPVWHSRGFSCDSWDKANELRVFLEHNDSAIILRVAPQHLQGT